MVDVPITGWSEHPLFHLLAGRTVVAVRPFQGSGGEPLFA